MGEQQNKIPELQYGEEFHLALCERLGEHFSQEKLDSEGGGHRALVAGLFGEWGSGKTLHLQHIHQYFYEQLPESTKSLEKPITFPIFFNAWRYEAEPHLIVPLLKSSEQQLKSWIKSTHTSVDEAEKWIQDKWRLLGNAAVALASGFNGQLTIPLEPTGKTKASFSLNPQRIFETFKQRQKEQQERNKTYIEKLSSLYYDFENQIKNLTQPGEDTHKLNLLFLIDDLDRCLPEKAVQMLESIKLFLDVQGCAFVLAVDDEVVERGIAHRYRDYGSTNNSLAMESIANSLHPGRYHDFISDHDHQCSNPITGHEYLEKMIQIPMRIPAPDRQQTLDYLTFHFNGLFGEP